MARPLIENCDLPDAIRWETIRLHYFQQHGFDTSEVELLLARYTHLAFHNSEGGDES